MKTFVIIIMMLLAIAFACVALRPIIIDKQLDTPKNDLRATKEYSDEIKVFFCPKDNCTSAILNFLDYTNVRCAFFDLKNKAIKNKIIKKSIPVFIEKDNYIGNYSFFRYDKDRAYMHNKFCVAKNAIMTGSTNPTYRGLNINYNNIIIIKSKYLAQRYSDEFKNLWTYDKHPININKKQELFFYNDALITTCFSPKGFCANKIIKEIRLAKKEIYFMTFSFTHKQIADAIVDAKQKGVIIRGIMERSQNSRYSRFNYLNLSIDVVWETTDAKLHNKIFIIDNTTVITGSMNPTKNGDLNNAENTIIIKDKQLAKQFLEEFDTIYQNI